MTKNRVNYKLRYKMKTRMIGYNREIITAIYKDTYATMDMADGNFTTNHALLGKKNGSEHDE